MAKKEAKAMAPAPRIVTVKDLAEEFGLDPREVRVVIRKAGYRAPKIEGAQGFGPKAKYEWKEGSEELEKIYQLLEARVQEVEPEEEAGEEEAEEEAEEEEEE